MHFSFLFDSEMYVTEFCSVLNLFLGLAARLIRDGFPLRVTVIFPQIKHKFLITFAKCHNNKTTISYAN